VGELLAQATIRPSPAIPRPGRRALASLAFAAAAIAALPIAMSLADSRAFLAADMEFFRLTNLPAGDVAASFGAWAARDGSNPRLWATLLPLVILVAAAWRMVRGKADPAARAALAFTAGPLLVALAFACQWLGAWSMVDCALLVMLATAVAATPVDAPRWQRWLWPGAVALGAIRARCCSGRKPPAGS